MNYRACITLYDLFYDFYYTSIDKLWTTVKHDLKCWISTNLSQIGKAILKRNIEKCFCRVYRNNFSYISFKIPSSQTT